jgi:hypothetical protein
MNAFVESYGADAHHVQSGLPKRIGNPGRSAFIQAPDEAVDLPIWAANAPIQRY